MPQTNSCNSNVKKGCTDRRIELVGAIAKLVGRRITSFYNTNLQDCSRTPKILYEPCLYSIFQQNNRIQPQYVTLIFRKYCSRMTSYLIHYISKAQIFFIYFYWMLYCARATKMDILYRYFFLRFMKTFRLRTCSLDEMRVTSGKLQLQMT